MITQMVAPVSRWYRLAIVVMLLVAALAGYALPGERRIDSLNFSNAEVTIVLKALADLSNANIVISPTVKGAITIKLTDVTVDEALQIITKELGLAYTVSGGAYVVGDPAMIKSMNPAAEAYEIVKLKALSAADVSSALSITFKDVQAKELPDSRLLITGDSKRLQAVLDFLQEIDIAKPVAPPPPPDTVEVVYQVKSVDPQQAKDALDRLYGSQGLLLAIAPRSAEGDNALVLHGPKPITDQAVDSLAKVDIAVKTSELRRSVKRVFATQAITFLLQRFAEKGLTIETLPMTPDQVSRQSGETGQSMPNIASAKIVGNAIGTEVHLTSDGKLNVVEPIGDFLLCGPENVVKEADVALTAIDVGPQRVDHIYMLRFLNVADAKKRLDDLYAADGLVTSIGPGYNGQTPDVVNNTNQAQLTGVTTATANSSSTADLEVNRLLLRGPEEVVARAEKLLDSLDVESQQISVHAEIISMSASEINNIGVMWPANVTASLNEEQSGNPLQLGAIVRNPISLSTTLNMMDSKNKIKIINRPTTVVQNGHEAIIHVGDSIYYEILSGYQNGTPIYQTNTIETGVTLRVRPMITKDGVITLEISSNVTGTPSYNNGADGVQLPVIPENSNATIVQMRDNETLVVGGLRQSTQQEATQGVPLLDKLPLIGSLFRNKQTTPSDTELVILVRPEILHPGAAPVTGTALPAVP